MNKEPTLFWRNWSHFNSTPTLGYIVNYSVMHCTPFARKLLCSNTSFPIVILPAPENVFLYKIKKKWKCIPKNNVEFSYNLCVYFTGTNVCHPKIDECICRKSHLLWKNEHAWIHFIVRTFCSITFSIKKTKQKNNTTIANNVLSISPYSDIIAYNCCPSVYLRGCVTAACWPVDCLWDSSCDADS